jgi:hypothetical protein
VSVMGSGAAQTALRVFANVGLALALALAPGCRRGGEEAAASATPPTSAQGASGAQRCGSLGEPDCPLQQWMKATLQAYLVSASGADHQRLAAALDKLAAAAPAGFPGWSDMARRGAEQARAGDTGAVRQSCTSCHDAHRARFRSELRGQRLF